MKREIILLGVTMIVAQQAVEAKRSTSLPARPNVLLINIDDLGWGDPSCYGGELFETPNMDRIAAQGIRCTDGYVAAPVSGVSRVVLLTGASSCRFGMQWNHDSHYLFNLKADENEKANVMNDNPAVMKQMLDAFFAYRAEMPAYLNPYRRPIDIPDPACKDIVVKDME